MSIKDKPSSPGKIMDPLDTRLKKLPVLEGAGKILGSAAADLGREELPKIWPDLAAGKISLEEALLGVAKTAAALLPKVTKEGRRLELREARANAQWRAALRQRQQGKDVKARTPKKGEYLVTGQVVLPDKEEPLPGLVVEAIDKDVAKPDIVGVDVTDSQGRFVISFRAKDFAERGEGLPEILFRVGWYRQELFLVTAKPLRIPPGEAMNVTLPLPPEAVATARRSPDYNTRLIEVDRRMAFDRLNQRQIQTMGQVLTEGFSQAVKYLEGIIAASGKGGARKTSP